MYKLWFFHFCRCWIVYLNINSELYTHIRNLRDKMVERLCWSEISFVLVFTVVQRSKGQAGFQSLLADCLTSQCGKIWRIRQRRRWARCPAFLVHVPWNWDWQQPGVTPSQQQRHIFGLAVLASSQSGWVQCQISPGAANSEPGWTYCHPSQMRLHLNQKKKEEKEKKRTLISNCTTHQNVCMCLHTQFNVYVYTYLIEHNLSSISIFPSPTLWLFHWWVAFVMRNVDLCLTLVANHGTSRFKNLTELPGYV